MKKTSRNRFAAFIVAMCMCLTMSAYAVSYGEELKPPTKTYTEKFSDVTKNHWAFKYIAEMADRGVIGGYPDGKFRPDLGVTRAEFAKIMVNAAGLTAKSVNVSSYADVLTTDWCSPFVEVAKEYLTGYIDAQGQMIYKPDDSALREDIAVALVKLKSYATRNADESILRAMFKDYESISDATKKYVALAVENKLISGYEDETFRAQDTITRAEAATLLWRAYQFGSDNKVVDNTPVAGKEPVVIGDNSAVKESEKDVSEVQVPEVQVPEVQVPEVPVPEVPVPVEKKYSTETLFDTDNVKDLVVDNSGRVFFIENDSIKYFDGKTVKTLASNGDDKFNFTYTCKSGEGNVVLDNGQEAIGSEVDFYYFNIDNLVYSTSLDKVFALGYYYEDCKYGQMNGLIAVWEVYPSVKVVTSGLYYNVTYCHDNDFLETAIPSGDFAAIDNNNAIYFCSRGISTGGDGVRNSLTGSIYMASMGKKISMYDEKIQYIQYCKISVGADGLYLYSEWFSTLYHSDMSTFVEVKTRVMDKVHILGNKDGNFYFENEGEIGNIYELTTAGKVNKFISMDEIDFKDGLPIKGYGSLVFDNKGNIVFFDSNNGCVRRINV